MIPNVAVVEVHNPYWRGIHLWIPLFLLWIPVILLSPLLLLILFAGCFAFRVSAWRAIGVAWAILSGLPGTHVRVEAGGNHILVELR